MKSVLSGAGFVFQKVDEEGDLKFTGKTLGFLSGLFAFMNPEGQLVKVEVDLATPDEEARNTFRSMRTSLMEKYGQPSNDFHFFTTPYFEGDGYEEQAIRIGKGTFATFWGPKGQGEHLALEITKSLIVSIQYESQKYHDEAERRRKKREAIF